MNLETDAPVEKWVEQIRAGDIGAISRTISAIEDRSPAAVELLQILFPFTGHAYQIGITGAPGTGKSTLVDCLTGLYRDEKKPVGILAVDPSSPFTGGAILGDRIRMQSHAADPGVYVRSVASRGHLGGLAEAVGDAALVLDAAGKDIILLETVGIGQSEVEVARLADCVVVVLMPGQGDEIQGLKAGVMEIGDIFVLNKSDQDNAGQSETHIRAVLEMSAERGDSPPPLILTVAIEHKGIAELGREIELHREKAEKSPDRESREVARWKIRLLAMLKERLMARFTRNQVGAKEVDALAAEIVARKKDPGSAVEELLVRFPY
jgi:LAO/AO transport system kinase